MQPPHLLKPIPPKMGTSTSAQHFSLGRRLPISVSWHYSSANKYSDPIRLLQFPGQPIAAALGQVTSQSTSVLGLANKEPSYITHTTPLRQGDPVNPLERPAGWCHPTPNVLCVWHVVWGTSCVAPGLYGGRCGGFRNSLALYQEPNLCSVFVVLLVMREIP